MACRTILSLCIQLGLQVSDLGLLCLFCKRELTVTDKIAFDLKKLNLVLRADGIYGCCRTCCKATAEFENAKYLQMVVEADGVESFTGRGILEVYMRCWECMKELEAVEKCMQIIREEPFRLVRGGWKGLCAICYLQK
ncbi:E6 [Erinaceus europaeus papillomavirus 1]|uniref:Protein E6 n=1 Tax=Erinaceus europaeus papillomavirus 1 TaxID=445217 RepID=B7TQN7_9PAPI|nr:E6 [Erinaceus europaeus papillomavirus 1]ACK76234.1 E6 [Erinaceus europaeus papillomavirus 1]